jgi:hypothetical protein
MEKQYVYILGNTKNPEIIKVGKTNRHPETRATELSKATGTIGKYFVEWFMEVTDNELAEKVAHFKLDKFRVDKNKEQFEISALEAHKMLETFIIPLFELNPPAIHYSESLKDEIRRENLTAKYKNILTVQEKELEIITEEEIVQKSREERINRFQERAKEYALSEREERIKNAKEKLMHYDENENDS